MKQFKTLLVAVVLFFGATSFVNAQSKVAHIDTQKLISEMPEMIAAKKQLEQVSKTFQADMKSLMDSYQAKIKQYQAEAETVTATMNETRQKEVVGMENNIREFQVNADKQLQQKQLDLIKPIQEKARLAIQKVARAKGVQYVLDATVGGGVLLAEGTDLYADVKKELGF